MVYLNADFIFPDEFADGRSYCFNFIDSMPSFTRKKTKTKYNSNTVHKKLFPQLVPFGRPAPIPSVRGNKIR